jgi:hypothetical protein
MKALAVVMFIVAGIAGVLGFLMMVTGNAAESNTGLLAFASALGSLPLAGMLWLLADIAETLHELRLGKGVQ